MRGKDGPINVRMVKVLSSLVPNTSVKARVDLGVLVVSE